MTNRSRAHASIATAATPEVRANRAAILAEKERLLQIAAAEDELQRAQEALEKATKLSVEHAAVNAAVAKLAELNGETVDGLRKNKAAA